MDQDAAYDNQAHVSDSAEYPPRWTRAAEAYRRRLGAANRARLGLVYGPGPRAAMDIFVPVSGREELVIFVHGGYWRRFGREYFSHFAEGAVARHRVVAMPSYELCPDVRVAAIGREVTEAIVTVAHEYEDLPIRLVGHSAGGHLVARIAVPGALPEDIRTRIRRVMAISPVSDLRPLLETSINHTLHLDPEEAAAESPALLPAPGLPVTVWVGENELPAFVDQARWLAEAWGADLVVEPGRHHFDVIDALADPESRMMAALLD